MTSSPEAYLIVAPRAGMFDAWSGLFVRYGDEIGTPIDERIAGTMWRWLLDGSYRLAGLLAFDERRHLAGFVHYHPFPRPLHGDEGCQVDDLYVAAPYRGRRLGGALLAGVLDIAASRGWGEISWTARSGDAHAPALSDVFGERAELVTYRFPLAARRG